MSGITTNKEHAALETQHVLSNLTPSFTYRGYEGLISLLRNEGYAFSSYESWREYNKVVILRHDIDVDIPKALKLAELETELGVSSVYYVLLRSDLYNFSSERNVAMLKQISNLGHEVGLHFDETFYNGKDKAQHVLREAKVLSEVIGAPVKSVSMHRPSQACLSENWQIPGIINSYSDTF